MNFSLMSLFDPNSFLMPLKWVQCLLVFYFLNSCFFSIWDGVKGFLKKLSCLMMNILSQGMKSPKLSLLFLLSLFFLLLIVNESGMIPFVFTSSSHLVFNFSFSLPFWLAGVYLLSVKSFLAHLVPLGSPLGLSPFLVLIELVSMVVRPISLSVRLMSNIMAGHMVLCLIQSLTGSSLLSSGASVMMSFFFISFELAVALVQAFVFVNLTFMYLKEAE